MPNQMPETDGVGADDAPTRAMHAKVSAAFAAVVECTGADRQHITEALRVEDPACAAELQRWLACTEQLGEESSSGFLVRPIVGLDRLHPSAAESETEAPQSIGPYRIVRSLGRGTFARVFLGEQDRPVRRRVAIKLLLRDMGASDILARFDRERHALARLHHACIASLFDVGMANGSPYFVMEWVDGAPITAFARERKMPIDERLRLFVGVCRATEHAHERGVIHRDLKPSNVLAFVADSGAAVKVIDFGVAKAIANHCEGPLGHSSLRTLAGALVGTPPYMSPELLDGGADDADTRCDIYALGALLHELIVARPLVDCRNGTVAEWRKQARERPRVHIDASTIALGERWRRDLEAIIETAASPDRNRRYRTAGELGDELERVLEGTPIRARPVGFVESLARRVRRHPLVCGLACGGLVAGATATVALVLTLSASAQNAELKASLFRSALASVASAESLADRLGVDEQRATLQRESLTTARQLVALEPHDRIAMDLLARTLQGAQEVAASMAERSSGDERSALREEASRLRREHLDIRTRIASQPEATIADHAAVAVAMVLIGNEFEGCADYDAARAQYERALGIEEGLLNVEPSNPLLLSRLCYSYERLSVLATRRGDSAVERTLALRRLELAEQLSAMQPTERYSRLNLAEARRFALAFDVVPIVGIASVSDGDDLCVEYLSDCRALARDYPWCKRSQRELAMALGTAAHRLADASEAPERISLLSEGEIVLRRALGTTPDDPDLIDSLASIVSDLSQEAEWSGDDASALARIDEQRALLRWLMERRPNEDIYAKALAICERRHGEVARRATAGLN